MGFAALWIEAFHVSFPMLYNYDRLARLETVVKHFGFCGVDIFLFLSGMGLVYAIQKASLSAFYVRRIQRVIVPFVLMGILQALLDDWSLLFFIQNIFCYSFLFKNIFSFLWFVPMIILLYTVFPLYYKIFIKSTNKIVFTIAVLALWLIISLCFKDTARTDIWFFTNRIPIFAVGILTGWISQQKDIVADRLTWITLAILFGLGVLLAYLTNYRDYYVLVPVSNCCVPTFLLAISICFLLSKMLDMLLKTKGLRRICEMVLGILNFYGTISLELYCIQEYLVSEFLYPLLKAYLAGVLYNIPLNLAILLILTGIAWVIHYESQWIWKHITLHA